MRLAVVCALCAFAASADELKVGGEIGHHLDLTVGKVLRHTDVEKDFLRFFRNRVPSEGRIRDCEQARAGCLRAGQGRQARQVL